jgi:gamma-glutamylcyclotransferase (GGCT)/AIG2-like uncharacterized protein YtfP
MSKFLEKNAEFIGEGYFYGKLYKISWYPGAILSQDANNKVYGHIYKVKDEEKTFKILDDYEGITETAEFPNEYKRVLTDAFFKTDEILKTWVYIYNLETTGLTQITSGNFLFE